MQEPAQGAGLGVLSQEPRAHVRNNEGFREPKGVLEVRDDDFLPQTTLHNLLTPSPASQETSLGASPSILSPFSYCFIPFFLVIFIKHHSFICHLHHKHIFQNYHLFFYFVHSIFLPDKCLHRRMCVSTIPWLFCFPCQGSLLTLRTPFTIFTGIFKTYFLNYLQFIFGYSLT